VVWCGLAHFSCRFGQKQWSSGKAYKIGAQPKHWCATPAPDILKGGKNISKKNARGELLFRRNLPH